MRENPPDDRAPETVARLEKVGVGALKGACPERSRRVEMAGHHLEVGRGRGIARAVEPGYGVVYSRRHGPLSGVRSRTAGGSERRGATGMLDILPRQIRN